MKYKDWTVEDWKRVIWSDESSIWIGVNPRRQWVIRPPGERLNRKYVKKTFKSAQVKVMVWACFTGERLGPLIVCDDGGIGADEYEDILYGGLFSLIDDLLEIPENKEEVRVADQNTFLFMQDNAPCHKQQKFSNFLKKIMFQLWLGLHSHQISILLRTCGQRSKHSFTSGFSSCSIIHLRVPKPDIAMERYYKKFGIVKEWN